MCFFKTFDVLIKFQDESNKRIHECKTLNTHYVNEYIEKESDIIYSNTAFYSF